MNRSIFLGSYLLKASWFITYLA